MQRIGQLITRGNRSTRWIVSVAILLALIVQVSDGFAESVHREQLIPILGVVYGKEPVGTVSYLILSIDVRDDVRGLAVHFRSTPGRFSPMAQTAVQQAIHRSARALGQSPDSWTVVLSMPYEGVTVYGDSLSAMVGLSVVALANGRFIAPDRVITGTVKPNGQIGAVGAVPLKVDAANQAHIRRILVPDERDTGDGDWQTPFLVHISPVGSVEQAYAALTAVTSRP